MAEQTFEYDVIGRYNSVLAQDETVTTDKNIFALTEELTIKHPDAESITVYHRDGLGLIDLSLRIIVGQ